MHNAIALEVRERSIERWGENRATEIIGTHPAMVATLERLARLADSDGPVLITGETGTGKELFARALYLLSGRVGQPFVSLNCAQYQEGQIIASELFGHKKGSFTGAITDHAGVFEAAMGGFVFLDEIGELSAAAQGMLLRALGEGEIVRVGESMARTVDVRVVAATNRDLAAMARSGQFRADLYYRLRHLQLRIPPLRARGSDWEAMLEHYLGRLSASRPPKRFSEPAMSVLSRHSWPGNVRELRGLVETGFHLSHGELIEPGDFLDGLESAARNEQFENVPLSTTPAVHADENAQSLVARMQRGESTFWELVYQPYMDRELSRSQVQALIARGLLETRGSYKRVLGLFGVKAEDYLRFMDFLRHHRLKPGR